MPRQLFLFLVLLITIQLSTACKRHNAQTAAVPQQRSSVTATDRPTKWWHSRYERNVAVAEEHGKELGLIFMGDSITENMVVARDVMNRLWAKYHPQEFGVGGDSTEQLLWRIQHGEVDGLNPKVVVILIGTNNLNNDTDDDIYLGIQLIVTELRAKLPESNLLVLGLLPRGENPDNINRVRVNGVNALLQKGIADNQHVFYLDIGKQMTRPDGTIDPAIMPDGLHPSAKGYETMFTAIQPTVDKLLKK